MGIPQLVSCVWFYSQTCLILIDVDMLGLSLMIFEYNIYEYIRSTFESYV
jgi:hypothetical protein